MVAQLTLSQLVQLLSVDDVGAVFSNWLAATSQTRHAEHVVAEVHGPGVANCPSGHASQAKPLVVPLQLPFLKVPVGQLVFLHAAHMVFIAPEEQPPVLYLPDAHESHLAHVVSVLPEHRRLWYFPAPQVAHTEHTLSVFPVHPPVLYLPDPQAEHEEHAVSDVPVQPPLIYWPDAHAAQAEHV